MRCLKPKGIPIKINEKTYYIKFTLDLIDELQTRVDMPINKLIVMAADKRFSENAIRLIILCATGERIETFNDGELEKYSVLIMSAYLEQFRFKGMEEEIKKVKEKPKEEPEYEFVDIEYWFYIGTVQLGFTQDEVWNMTLGQILTIRNQDAKYKGLKIENKEVNIDDVIPY